MAFLDKNGLQTLTNKLVQGDAIKVASHRGHTIANVIDNITRECENVATPNTMTLENRVNEFRVGKGRDVDVSGDVEEGKVEVELKGKTWQNLLMPNLDKADNEGYVMYPKGEYKSYPDKNNYKGDAHMIKPNTTYTFIVDIKSIAKGMSLEINFTHSNHCFNYIAISEGIGVYKIKAVSKSDLSECTRIIGDRVKLGTYEEDTVYRIILLEGDYTQTPIEELPLHFEGIQSSFEDGIVDVEVVGKNLLSDYSLYDNNVEKLEETNEYIITRGDGNIGGGIAFRNTIVEPDTYYSFSMTCQRITPDNHNSSIRIWHTNNKEYINVSLVWIDKNMTRVKGAFKTPKDCSLIDIWCGKSSHYSEKTTFKFMKDWQLEKNKKATPSQPYYKKKISFNIGEPLRSLPNGVCDEIRNNNGQWELARRCGKTILNGKEEWQFHIEDTNTIRCLYTISAMKMTDKYLANMICDLFKVVPNSEWRNDTEQIEQGCTRSEIGLRINKTKLSSQDVAGFKQWLSKNPTTVYYELQTPIITPIEPIEFEVKPLATMTINSDIAPISNHKVVLNRAGQIEQGIVQIAELKKRVDSLETAYDSYLLETQHKLSILGFEYELESEEI